MGGLGSGRWGGYRKRLTVEQCAVLDVRQLRATLGAAVDLTTAQAITLSYTAIPGEPPVVATVWLVTTTRPQGGQHLRLLCPIIRNGEPCNRRVEKLYLPPAGSGERYFGCKPCHRLTHRSSQQSHRYDTLVQALGLPPSWPREDIVGAR
jgi:hypothetical protein